MGNGEVGWKPTLPISAAVAASAPVVTTANPDAFDAGVITDYSGSPAWRNALPNATKFSGFA